jgi:hypothetical protein
MQRRQFIQTLAMAPMAGAAPSAISIDGGRQLFFDDRLIAETGLERTWHLPVIHEASPVLKPESPLEMNNGQRPVACPFSDGLFYDPKDRLFKLWYHAGWFDGIAYATSEDGIHWVRPNLDVEPGTNRVLAKRDGYWRDGSTTWLDLEASDPSQRFKMFAYFRRRKPDTAVGEVYTSPDGIHWKGPKPTGPISDNSNFFYDPFRKLWVWSIRPASGGGRKRMRRVHPDFLAGASWEKSDVIGPLLQPDSLDLPDPQLGYPTELYHMEAAAYENFLLGVFLIHRGPPNGICAKEKIPKITEMTLAYSRDGETWLRPDRRPFVGASRKIGAWNRAYIHPAGGVCLVVGEKLHFYFGAWSGVSPKLGGDMYAGGSTGLAVLRRDGFASLNGTGTITTPPVVFSGKYMFINAETQGGEVAAEIVGKSGFGVKNCVPLRGDGTCQPVRWKDQPDLSSLSGQPVQFRFHLTRAKLYSFWVSPAKSGASTGYVAAGGPGFSGPRDTVGAGLNLL